MDAPILGLLIRIVGMAVFLLGWWPCLREMFEENRGLGYLSFMVPVLPMVYAVLHWDDLKRHVWVQLIGAGLFGLSFLFHL